MRYFLLLLATLVVPASAGEVRLREFHSAGSGIVRLSDVADFTNIPADVHRSIENLPLMPAPIQGQARRISAQDVREIMSLYGLSLPALRVSGECRVEGSSALVQAEQTPRDVVETGVEADAESTAAASVRETVRSELIAYLQNKDRLRTTWSAEFHLSEAQTQLVAAMSRSHVTGGQSPWTGRQSFVVRDRAAPQSNPVTFQADVVRVAQAIVLARPVETGAILTENDVELAEVNPSVLSPGVLMNLSDAVGRQLKRPATRGQVLQTNMVQKPMVVKRGELVTVYSVAAGVQVKALAKALADAGVGDVVQLESSDSKKQYQARVTAPQEAMVFIDTPTVAAERSTRTSMREVKRK